ncbi:flavin-containing monooxygenase [Streptomyces thermolilacinus]|uniref:FAD-dependent oxidoreductase n=1 Tax=Streptomyces thermolilacinus SPC6 TaxID=1306406 RepID=A0A1D3DTB6_9ACTN|nr:NAD(P)/FAD-dependent oxidoreductase [Streptomyces thermolilacinus]OEJ95568.1 FAD-dependent oxidoreductase [Streptomyces thermolilacinus SPC6]
MKHVDVAVVGGGQAGLATAYALIREGLRPVVLEASERAAGSWPRYYDSLTVFSPARYCALPGMPFGGDPHRYPHRDEIVEYLTAYAARLDAEIRTGRRVTGVREEAGGYVLHTAGGERLAARAVVAASGTFGRPHRPDLPGFTGTVLHAAEYREPAPFAGQRVLVVGSGNSAVQIAVELARGGRVTLASRRPVRFAPQRPFGRDLHFWLTLTGLDNAPLGRFLRTPPPQPVIDDGRYRVALASGAPDRRAMFDRADGRTVTWPDGTREDVDTIVLATGYRPDLPYLDGLGVLDERGCPRHRDGTPPGHPRLGFVGLEWQRSLSSNALRGVGRDANRLARRLAARLSEG